MPQRQARTRIRRLRVIAQQCRLPVLPAIQPAARKSELLPLARSFATVFDSHRTFASSHSSLHLVLLATQAQLRIVKVRKGVGVLYRAPDRLSGPIFQWSL